ncbi:hypothetical protein [Rhizobium sp. NPDC090279]|uniref:hypothetical protein n=1 Tax=Rhizobium sp. NPDC090279 TaxID=3364499 RepID=UPI003839E34B
MIETYVLRIAEVTVDELPSGARLNVQYQGLHEPTTINVKIDTVDVRGLMKGCEVLARRIFIDEFRLNNGVEMHFILQDANGLALWHTNPLLYLKCPLTMTMKWNCTHLSRMFKTMTTLGIVELPKTVLLEDGRIDKEKSANVIMDSMANGVEFMGNLIFMRNAMDHEFAKRSGVPSNFSQV